MSAGSVSPEAPEHAANERGSRAESKIDRVAVERMNATVPRSPAECGSSQHAIFRYDTMNVQALALSTRVRRSTGLQELHS
jgi:hypothetical protein